MAKMVKARPLSEWHEGHGQVLWWFFPMTEAPYVGSPLDSGMTVEVAVRYYEDGAVRETVHRHFVGRWPGYHTHWTPLPPLPEAPALEEAPTSGVDQSCT